MTLLLPCAAEGEWKTNMCAKIIDFYGDVYRRKKLAEQEDAIDRYCGDDNNLIVGNLEL